MCDVVARPDAFEIERSIVMMGLTTRIIIDYKSFHGYNLRLIESGMSRLIGGCSRLLSIGSAQL
jgi:hypothetical protein